MYLQQLWNEKSFTARQLFYTLHVHNSRTRVFELCSSRALQCQLQCSLATQFQKAAINVHIVIFRETQFCMLFFCLCNIAFAQSFKNGEIEKKCDTITQCMSIRMTLYSRLHNIHTILYGWEGNRQHAIIIQLLLL